MEFPAGLTTVEQVKIWEAVNNAQAHFEAIKSNINAEIEAHQLRAKNAVIESRGHEMINIRNQVMHLQNVVCKHGVTETQNTLGNLASPNADAWEYSETKCMICGKILNEEHR